LNAVLLSCLRPTKNELNNGIYWAPQEVVQLHDRSVLHAHTTNKEESISRKNGCIGVRRLALHHAVLVHQIIDLEDHKRRTLGHLSICGSQDLLT
jgi:hypothetical protein